MFFFFWIKHAYVSACLKRSFVPWMFSRDQTWVWWAEQACEQMGGRRGCSTHALWDQEEDRAKGDLMSFTLHWGKLCCKWYGQNSTKKSKPLSIFWGIGLENTELLTKKLTNIVYGNYWCNCLYWRAWSQLAGGRQFRKPLQVTMGTLRSKRN